MKIPNELKRINENQIIFKRTDDVCKLGLPVKISENFTVSACYLGDDVVGQVTGYWDDYARVQTEGLVVFPYSGDAPSLGYTKLAADRTGGVRAWHSGREYLVVAVDKELKQLGIIL